MQTAIVKTLIILSYESFFFDSVFTVWEFISTSNSYHCHPYLAYSSHSYSACSLAYCVTSRREWALLSFPDVCPDFCLSVCHPTAYSLPGVIDHNQIWYAGTYLSSHGCKPFWIPQPPYSGSWGQKYANFRLRTTLNGCRLDIRIQIRKSRRESMRMSMDSIVSKYQQIRSRIVARVGFYSWKICVALTALPMPTLTGCRRRHRRRRRCWLDADDVIG